MARYQVTFVGDEAYGTNSDLEALTVEASNPVEAIKQANLGWEGTVGEYPGETYVVQEIIENPPRRFKVDPLGGIHEVPNDQGD